MAPGAGAPSSMRVLAVYPWPTFWSMGEGRGAAAFFLSITSFPRHGHELHVLMPGLPGSPADEDYHGVRLHRMATRVDFMPERGRSRVLQHARILGSYLYWRVRARREALALARRVRPDVLLGMGALGAPVAREVARALDLPNVTRLFGTSLGEVAGSPVKRALRYPETIAFRTPAAALIVCDDGSGGDEIARGLGVPAERLVFLPDGVDKGRFAGPFDREHVRRSLNVAAADGVVLSVCRLHPEKHVERLIGAAQRVLAARPETTLVIVGEGEEEARLKALALELGVASSVVFTGAVSLEDLPGIYGAADVFVTVSDRTNVLNPLNEAMMSGLAVVALNTGRTADVIRHGENGVLVEPAELATLADTIAGLLSDDARRRALGAAARTSAARRLPGIEERQAKEVEIVERAVARRRAAR